MVRCCLDGPRLAMLKRVFLGTDLFVRAFVAVRFLFAEYDARR